MIFRLLVTSLSYLLILSLFTGCSLLDGSDVDDVEEFQNALMSSYRLLSPESPGPDVEISDLRINNHNSIEVSRVVAPVWSPYSPRELVANAEYTIDGYPEFDLSTMWTYKVKNSSENIWKVSVNTYFPEDEWVDRVNEVYFIQDNGDGFHDAADAYVDNNGDSSSTYRKKFRSYFNDGTSRRDAIEGDSNSEEYQYALFDIDADLDFEEEPVIDLFESGEDRWSSKITYSHNAKRKKAWPWWGILERVNVEGEQYYSREDNIQTFLIIEDGSAKNVDWSDDDETEPVKRTRGRRNKYLFNGVIKIQIDDNTSTRTIKGHYIIYKKNGDTLEFLIDNDTVTKL